jgi:hypothetical protein
MTLRNFFRKENSEFFAEIKRKKIQKKQKKCLSADAERQEFFLKL